MKKKPVSKNTEYEVLTPLFDAPLRAGAYWGGVYHKEVPHFGDKSVPINSYFSDAESLKPHISIMNRNIILDEAHVGDTPFSKEFYKHSPVVKGVNNAEELVVVFDLPIGNSVIYSSMVVALEKYISIIGIPKEIVLVTRFPELFVDFVNHYKNIRVLADKNIGDNFKTARKRYVFNINEQFRDADAFGMSEEEFKDEKNVLNFYYSAWNLEQRPFQISGKTFLKLYYMLATRVMRNTELLLGTKLFDDISQSQTFWPPIHNYKKRNTEMRKKLNIKNEDIVITISFGASVMPKEYMPEKWLEVINSLFKDEQVKEKVKLVCINDPDIKKMYKYENEVVRKLPPEIMSKTRITSLKIEDVPVLMKMSSVVVTPDTGFGHLASSIGTMNVMISATNPGLWSSLKSRIVAGVSGSLSYQENRSDFTEMWASGNKDEYLITDQNGKLEGASTVAPERIVAAILDVLKEKGLII